MYVLKLFILHFLTLYKGLGPTVPELGIQEHGIKPVEKTQFSMVLPQIMESLKANHAQVCGNVYIHNIVI